LTINQKEIEKLLSEAHSVIKLVNDGKEQRCVIKEIQYHPVKGDVIHVDLQRIKAGQEIQLSVPIKFIGEAPGVKMGGVFQTIRSELDISTLPKFLPNEIEVDISKLEIGDSLHISDLDLEHITIHHEPESSLCSVVMPKKVEEPVEEEEEGEEFETEEEESAEPEVISSKSKDEDEEQKSDEG
jgi:large subunit ribosomal protein L25